MIATKDYHIDPGTTSTRTGLRQHLAGALPGRYPGAEFHPNLDTERIEAIFTKGEFEAGSSGFQGKAEERALVEWLKERGVTEVEIVGIATDRSSGDRAGRRQGRVRYDGATGCTAGVARETTDRALAQMREAGVTLTGTPVVAS